jgi:hypothetical protein
VCAGRGEVATGGSPAGQSGNPRGRLPDAKNIKTLLTKALNEIVVVTYNGGRRKLGKHEAIVTQLVNRSAKADFKAIQIVFHIGAGATYPL